MVAAIDLNSDIGEGYGAWPGGPDDELLTVISSANVACGFHAGDPTIMRATCLLAGDCGVTIGAQVGYPDLAGFGRRFLDMAANELTDAVVYQLAALDGFARLAGSAVSYVKPHGALYNAVVHHERQAAAVVAAVREYDATLAVLGLPASQVRHECERAGLRFVPEGFADRAYDDGGTLVPRTRAGAVILEPERVAAQARRLAAGGTVESLCVHSDTPGAVELVRAVRAALAADGTAIRPFATS